MRTLTKDDLAYAAKLLHALAGIIETIGSHHRDARLLAPALASAGNVREITESAAAPGAVETLDDESAPRGRIVVGDRLLEDGETIAAAMRAQTTDKEQIYTEAVALATREHTVTTSTLMHA